MLTVLAVVGCLGLIGVAGAGAVDFGWARGWGSASDDRARGVAVDGAGNVYTTGFFWGTADFDPGAGTSNLTPAGSYDVFVSKLDAAGNLVWARQLGGTGGDMGIGVAVDGAGNVYTTGHFYGTADFDPGAGTFDLTSAGSAEVFVSKLDTAGNFVWARQLGGASGNSGGGVAVDGAGNVYTTGHFQRTADFDPSGGVSSLSSAGTSDVFVWKLDAAGNLVWARQLGGASGDQGYGVAVDGAGNVYTTGYFQGTADFDPGPNTFNLTAAGGSYDVFVSKLDSLGNLVWARQLGGTGTDVGYEVAVDGAGNAYTTGYFQGTADFDPGTSVFSLASAGGNDVFVWKLDTAGNLVWARQLGGATGDEQGYGVAVDGAGSVYTTGTFYGTADFDPGAGTFNLTSAAGSADVFVSKLDAAGNLVWAGRLGGSGYDDGFGVAVDGAGSVYTTGLFAGTADFDPGPGVFDLTSAGSLDVFVVKLSGAPSVVSIGNASALESAGTMTFALTLDKSSSVPVSVDWTTQDNTAVSLDDYTGGSGTVTFPAGVTTQTVSIKVVDDAIDEVNESFRVQLSNPVSGTIAGSGRATGTIRDDDATPRMTILGATWWENVGALNLRVLLDRPSSRTVTVNYTTVNGTGSAPGDYTTVSGTVSFPPGSTVQFITVPVVDDVLREGVENFRVVLSGVVFATITPLGIGIGTIIDNDLAL